jgi:hypothetical protein
METTMSCESDVSKFDAKDASKLEGVTSGRREDIHNGCHCLCDKCKQPVSGTVGDYVKQPVSGTVGDYVKQPVSGTVGDNYMSSPVRHPSSPMITPTSSPVKPTKKRCIEPVLSQSSGINFESML